MQEEANIEKNNGYQGFKARAGFGPKDGPKGMKRTVKRVRGT
jgi:hypothetical protein